MQDPPLIVVWPYALGFWCAAVWLYWLHFRLFHKAGRSDGVQDAGTLRLIVIVGRIAEVVAVVLAFVLPAAGMANQVESYFVGVALIFGGAGLRLHCMRMLGARFTPYVVVTSDQTVVETGAYRWVRHPSYTAGMIIMLGLGLALGNWASIVVLLTSAVALYIHRVGVEERTLLAVLGDAYASYMRRTKRFIPFVV